MSQNTVVKFLLGFMLLISPTFAAPPKQLGKFGEWTAYMTTQDGKKVCYIVGFPKSKKGKYSKRGEVYTLVTHRPTEKSSNVMSFHLGYPLKLDAPTNAKIDNKQKFPLFNDAYETAWSSSEKDNAIVTALTKGREMIVTGVSKRGTHTEDKYSLTGSHKALQAINKACGVK